jgi:hypothetical protein
MICRLCRDEATRRCSECERDFCGRHALYYEGEKDGLVLCGRCRRARRERLWGLVSGGAEGL